MDDETCKDEDDDENMMIAMAVQLVVEMKSRRQGRGNTIQRRKLRLDNEEIIYII